MADEKKQDLLGLTLRTLHAWYRVVMDEEKKQGVVPIVTTGVDITPIPDMTTALTLKVTVTPPAGATIASFQWCVDHDDFKTIATWDGTDTNGHHYYYIKVANGDVKAGNHLILGFVFYDPSGGEPFDYPFTTS